MSDEVVTQPVIDAEAEEVELGTEVVPSHPPTTLFRTDDPAEVLKRATGVANALGPVIKSQKLSVQIQGKEHITVEGWQTLGAMLGVTPVCVWTHELDNGWEARVEARTLDGRVVGAAEAECLTAEKRWEDADDYAVRSMAQTRATSKALASVLRFVATLGGFSGTPAEEMPRDSGRKLEGEATANQKRAITTILNKGGVSKDFQRTIVHKVAGNPPSKAGASQILDILKTEGRSLEDSIEALLKEAELRWPSDIPLDKRGLDEPPLDDDPAVDF